MSESRTAVLANQIADVPGRLVVTYDLDHRGMVERITLAYEVEGREIDPYTVSYERIPVPSVGIYTPNTNLAFPERADSAEETWANATAYYLSSGVLSHLHLTATQIEHYTDKVVEPLSRAVQFLSADPEKLRSYPARFHGTVRFELSTENGQLHMSDVIDIRTDD